VEQPTWAGGVHSPDTPSLARVRDYWLDGAHHSDADRTLADQFNACAPHVRYLVRTHRELLRRMVNYLVRSGVRQFLDLGSGVPTGGHVHEVAQAIESDCRVLYVDIRPDIVAQGHRLLAENPNAGFACADMRSPEQVLSAPEREDLIDLDQPVAVLLVDVLHHVIDEDRPKDMLDAYIAAMSEGSYVGLSHLSEDQATDDARSFFTKFYGPLPAMTFREPADLLPFFEHAPLVDPPGLVPVPLWHPDGDMDRHPELFHGYAGLGRKYGSTQPQCDRQLSGE
jgi:S-adenosyl methyltransferase